MRCRATLPWAMVFISAGILAALYLPAGFLLCVQSVIILLYGIQCRTRRW